MMLLYWVYSFVLTVADLGAAYYFFRELKKKLEKGTVKNRLLFIGIALSGGIYVYMDKIKENQESLSEYAEEIKNFFLLHLILIKLPAILVILSFIVFLGVALAVFNHIYMNRNMEGESRREQFNNRNKKGGGKKRENTRNSSKTKRINKQQIFFLLVVQMAALCNQAITANASGSNNANRFNVVFVMDASGSMKESDSEGWRYDAVELFLALATNTGNYGGSVVFSRDILYTSGTVTGLSGKQEKLDFAQKMRVEPEGATDIGEAILEAVTMLEQSKNEDLPSAVIILTDGNTFFGGKDAERELQQSEADREEAISIAVESGYPIYSVCLNADESADVRELKYISQRTGGECIEVARAEDIKEVFKYFYNMIYDTETITLLEDTFEKDDIREEPIPIPDFGVEELNIIISTLNEETSFEIYRPEEDEPIPAGELEDSIIRAKSFSVVKLVDPEPGEWRLRVKGKKGDDILVTMVYNANYQIRLDMEEKTEHKNLGDVVSLGAYLIEGEEKITDAGIYQEYSAKLLVTHDGKTEELDMEPQGERYVREYALKDYGTYRFQVLMPIDGMNESSLEYIVEVDNQFPQAVEGMKEWKVYAWSFQKKEYTYDLTGTAVDAEDGAEVIRYRISAYDPAEFACEIAEENMLLLYNEEKTDISAIFREPLTKKGSIRLKAYDSCGADCDVELEVTVVAANRFVIRLISGAAAVLLIIGLVVLWKVKHRAFDGEAFVETFDRDSWTSGKMKQVPLGKGKTALSDAISGAFGINTNRIWLVSTGKDYIYVKSSGKLYSDLEPDKQKKRFVLDDGMSIELSKDEECRKGIRISWKYGGDRY